MNASVSMKPITPASSSPTPMFFGFHRHKIGMHAEQREADHEPGGIGLERGLMAAMAVPELRQEQAHDERDARRQCGEPGEEVST